MKASLGNEQRLQSLTNAGSANKQIVTFHSESRNIMSHSLGFPPDVLLCCIASSRSGRYVGNNERVASDGNNDKRIKPHGAGGR